MAAAKTLRVVNLTNQGAPVRQTDRATTTPRPDGPATPGLLRTMNDRTALELFLDHGALSRSDLARMTGISKPTASQVLLRLEQSRLVVEAEPIADRPGRAAQLYRLNPGMTYAAAVDITPGAVVAQVADVTGRVVGQARRTRPSRAAGSGPGTAIEVLDEALRGAGLNRGALACVALAAPGAYDELTDQLRYGRNVPAWGAPGIAARLRGELGCEVVVENDVTLAAVAEQRTGSARGVSDFFLLWIDEGVGGAVVLDGRLHRGASGGAGELAFLPLPQPETVRRPVSGSAGAYQRWVGAAHLRELAAEHGLTGRDPVRLITAAVAAAAESEPAAFLDALAARYALALAAVISVLDPEAVVLAGRYVHAGGEPLRVRIARELDRVAVRTPQVLRSAFAGQDAVIEGARHVALDRARDRAFATT